jgi:hypothetical protein
MRVKAFEVCTDPPIHTRVVKTCKIGVFGHAAYLAQVQVLKKQFVNAFYK